MNVSQFLAFPDARTWTGTFNRQQKRWLKKVVAPVQPISGMLARAYVDQVRLTDYAQANDELRRATQGLQRYDLNLSWSDDELADWCERKAQKGMALLRESDGTDSTEALMELVFKGLSLLTRYGMKAPDIDALGPRGFLSRLGDPAWWRKMARRFQRQEVEKLAILLRRVCKGREIYCSDETVRRRSAQKFRNRRYLENTEAQNELKQRYTLAELADLSISNPKLRRGELMLRIRGFDEVAQLLGHVREFWTMTTPSRFHRWTTMGNVQRENPRWDGSTPRDAQDWLTERWAKIRSALGRRGIRLYGFRVVEAHHDGTPHWHAALFYSPHWMRQVDEDEAGKPIWEEDETRAAAPRVRAIVRRYLLEEEREIFRDAVTAESRAGQLWVRALGPWHTAHKRTLKVTARTAVARYLDCLDRENKAYAAKRDLVAAIDGTRKAGKQLAHAIEHRCDFKVIDPEKGDAAGYLAKYITKAIDAADAADLVQQDLYGYDMGDSARRVEAWASCHGIRQFQQIGGPSVSAWRELRRALSDDITQADLFDAPMPVQHAATAADEGDWQAFVLLMGGPCVKRDSQLVRLGYWNEHNAETGEVVGRVFNRYGELAEKALFGLTYDDGEKAILTRVHTWTVHRPGEEKPVTKTAPDLESNTSKAMRETQAGSEWKPWAFVSVRADELRADVLGMGPFKKDEQPSFWKEWKDSRRGFCSYGAPPGAPLEFCQ